MLSREEMVYCNQNKTIFKHKCRKIEKFVEEDFDVKKSFEGNGKV